MTLRKWPRCRECGALFERRTKADRFCSPECRRRRRNAVNRHRLSVSRRTAPQRFRMYQVRVRARRRAGLLPPLMERPRDPFKKKANQRSYVMRHRERVLRHMRRYNLSLKGMLTSIRRTFGGELPEGQLVEMLLLARRFRAEQRRARAQP